MLLSRRSLLRGLVAAPAVIAVERLMPVKLWVPPKPSVLMLSPLELWGSHGSGEAVFLGIAEAGSVRNDALDIIVQRVTTTALIDQIEFRRNGRWLVRDTLVMPQAVMAGDDFKATLTIM